MRGRVPPVSAPVSSRLMRLVGQVEQPQQVRHGHAAASDTAAHVLSREAELLHERGAGARLLDDVEVLPRHVLDQRELEGIGVVAVAHDGRDRVEAGELRRPPPALAGDQLVGAAGDRPHEHRLQDTAGRQRLREALERLVVEGLSGLVGARGDQVERQRAQLLLLDRSSVGHRQDRCQAPAHSAVLLSHVRPPPWRGRSRRRRRRCGDRDGSRDGRSSAPR